MPIDRSSELDETGPRPVEQRSDADVERTQERLTKFLTDVAAEHNPLVAAGAVPGEGAVDDIEAETEKGPGQTSVSAGDLHGSSEPSAADPPQVDRHSPDEGRAACQTGEQQRQNADPDAVDSAVNPSEYRDPEFLHAFGNKELPRPPRPDKDFMVGSWDAVVGPYSPSSPTDEVKGMSTFIDPFHPEATVFGKYHRLPPGYAPPEESGLAIHADGNDIHPKAEQPWGHRTIYPTEPMTVAEFARRVAELPWEYAGNKKKDK